MTDFKIIKNILNCTIRRIFLIVFPPFGEQYISQVDIRIGLVTEGNVKSLYVIGTNMEDLWSPLFSIEQIPTDYFSELEFQNRIENWMCQKFNDDIGLEYYDFTKSKYFNNIIGESIIDIELLNIKDNPEPFGIKLLFPNDFILSLPNSDGNTIETKTFNKNESIKNFEYLGDVIYSKV